MAIILNGVLGQEGYIGVGVKDSFLLLISHGFTLIITDFFLKYTSLLNYGFMPKFNNKPASIFFACPPSSSSAGLRPCPIYPPYFRRTSGRRGGERAFK